MKERVEVVEVSPRDGLQSDPTILPTAAKLELIRRLVGAGLRRIETVSFVNPKRVPQMADADDVMAGIRAADWWPSDASAIGLVLNDRGLARAIDTGVDEINVVVVCSDTFAERNQGQSTQGLIDAWLSIAEQARNSGLATSVTLAASFGCPFEGEVPPERVAWVAEQVSAGRPDEIALADSIGVAVPTDVTERVELVAAAAPGIRLRGHFHNTRNTGFANAVAAVQSGVRVLDSSLGGIGGCPFAPNATGNIATEDLVNLLHRMGWSTGVDLAELSSIVPWVEGELGHGTPGLLAKAGIFPDVARNRAQGDRGEVDA